MAMSAEMYIKPNKNLAEGEVVDADNQFEIWGTDYH